MTQPDAPAVLTILTGPYLQHRKDRLRLPLPFLAAPYPGLASRLFITAEAGQPKNVPGHRPIGQRLLPLLNPPLAPKPIGRGC
jgi:hypothetical protein